MTTESRIDTKLFTTTAETVAAVTKDLESCFQDWGKIMQSSRGSWQGGTSDDIKNVAEAVQRSASDMLRSLGGYRAALNEMRDADNAAKQAAQNI